MNNSNIINNQTVSLPEEDGEEKEENRLVALRTQEENDTEKIAGDLMLNDYNKLVQKYGQHLFDLVVGERPNTYTNVVSEIQLYGQSFITNFIPPLQGIKTTNELRNNILQLMGQLPPQSSLEQINQQLKKINPLLTVPERFNLSQSIQDAIYIKKGYENIRLIIANNMAYDYLGDVNHFVNFNSQQLDNLSESAEDISEKLAQEYERLGKNPDASINQTVIDETLSFLKSAGRTPLFLEDLKNDNNAGDIADLMIKITTALQIGIGLKKQFPSTLPSKEQIIDAIKEHVLADINI